MDAVPGARHESASLLSSRAPAIHNHGKPQTTPGGMSENGKRPQVSVDSSSHTHVATPPAGAPITSHGDFPVSLPRKKGLAPWLHRWGWETSACIGSLVAFSATVGLLKCFDGKTQPEWPYGITLNSAVSWLAVITKSLLLVPAATCISQTIWISYTSKTQNLETLVTYDAASRGPWGSLELLWALRARQLACMGALLTILAIGIEPTLQQTITIRTRNIKSTQNATVPASQTFVRYDSVNDVAFPPTLSTIGAIYSGLFSSSPDSAAESPVVIPTCPTGNCQYPAFQTLAICSKCVDIGNRVSKNCTELSLFDIPEPVTFCQFSLPNGLQINQTLQTVPGETEEFIEDYTVHVNGFSPLVEPMGNQNSVLNVTILKGVIERDGSTPVNATQCTLQWCVNTYESAVSNGRFEENLQHSWIADTEESEDVIVRLRPPPVSDTSSRSTFTLGSAAIQSLKDWLATKMRFGNSWAVQQGNSNGTLTLIPDVSGRSCETGNPDNPDFISLFQQSDPRHVIENLAATLTTYIRSSRDQYAEGTEDFFNDLEIAENRPARGTAYDTQPYIEIRWQWLSYAGFVILLTTLFFALVVAQSTKSEVPIWKFSPLALLFHGLGTSSTSKRGIQPRSKR